MRLPLPHLLDWGRTITVHQAGALGQPCLIRAKVAGKAILPGGRGGPLCVD